MTLQYVWPADNHVVGDLGHTTDHNALIDLLKLALPINICDTQWAGGADYTGTNDSTAAINAALLSASPGQVVTGYAGTYKVSGPVLIPPGVSFRGPSGSVQAAVSNPDIGIVLQPTGAWGSPGLPVSGVITIIDMASNGIANTARERHDIRDIWIDGTSGPANLDGIASWGAMKAVNIANVGIANMTGRGCAAYTNTNFSSANNPGGWKIDTLLILDTGNDGFVYPGADATFWNIHAQMFFGISTTGDGIKITGVHNQLFGCRGDQYVNGVTFDVRSSAAPAGLDGNIMIGGGTQNNQHNGLFVKNSSSTGQTQSSPLTVVGAQFDGDGQNSGSGGGGYAGVAVAGVNTVELVGCKVLVSTGNVAGGCPQYALATASTGSGPGVPDLINVEGGFLNGVTAAINDAAPATQLRVPPSVSQYAGGQYVQASSTPAQPVQRPDYTGAVVENFAHPVPNVVAATMPRLRATTVTPAMTSGTLYVMAFGMSAGTKISAATVFTNTTAKAGGSHGWYCVLDLNRKVVAVTADQTDPATVWGAASTGYPLSFAAPAIAQYSGVYYFGIMVAATTMPTFASGVTVASGLSIATGISSPYVLAGPSSTGQTTPPSVGTTMGAIGNLGSWLPYAYLT